MTVIHWATKGKYGRDRNQPSRREWERHRAKINREWEAMPSDPMQFHWDWVAQHKELAPGPGLPTPVDWQKVPPEKWAQIRAEIFNYQEPST